MSYSDIVPAEKTNQQGPRPAWRDAFLRTCFGDQIPRDLLWGIRFEMDFLRQHAGCSLADRLRAEASSMRWIYCPHAEHIEGWLNKVHVHVEGCLSETIRAGDAEC